MERWKNIPGFELKYAVSDRGRVYSFANKGWRFLTPRVRRNSGHVSVALNGVKQRYIHELVLTTFVGPCPPGMQARHLNGVPNYNWLDNLEWNTPGVNVVDKKHHDGQKGKLLIGEVISIKQSLALGVKRCDLAKEYGVSYSTIRCIANGQNHAEVPTWPNP
jgi:hypothetical protein